MASMRICSLASGSSGNATYIATERTALLVDSGPPARDVAARLASIGVDPARLDGILITHAHSDHYRSAGTLNARFGVPVFCDPSTADALAWRGRYSSWKRLTETRPIPERIGDIEVQALDTPHGFSEEGRTVAYLLNHHQTRVAVVTDLGTVPEQMLRRLRGVNAIVLEANYDEATIRRKLADPRHAADHHYLSWVLGDRGHLSNQQCAETLAGILTDRDAHVFLGHLSENHDDPRQDNNDYKLAYDVVAALLKRERLPMPHMHRTFRIGRRASGPSDLLDI
jgi:phosphoribosyl 1,2-cyclic phosphodiesterase